MSSDSGAPEGGLDKAAVGFIGLGAMGGRMAHRLVDAGHPLCAYDPSPAAMENAASFGAVPARSVADVATQSDVVLLSLPSPEVAREVVAGPEGLCSVGGFDCLIDLSTTGLKVAQEMASALTGAGIDVIDAPVSGGVRGAEQGTLAIMAAATDEVLARHRGILETLGAKIFHVGEAPGQGQVMKLVNNVISAAAMIATAEGMVLGAKAGLEPKVMIEVLNASTGRNSHTEDKFPRFVLPRTFNFGFTIGLLQKDVRLGLEMAASLGVPMLVTGNAHQVWNIALDEGGPQADMTTIVQYFERWAGVEISE